MQLDQIARLPFVVRVSLPDYAVTNTGSVTSEGDSIHKADQVRAAPQGVDGSGVLVGVISNGVDHRNDAAATGNLPETAPGSGVADIQIDGARPGGANEDEGTAMLEIVHDLAPGADLAFSGPNDDMDMVNSINWLANTADANVIVDDLSFFLQPYFLDGTVATAAKAAVTVSGRCYVSSAGNHARKHHQRLYANVAVVNAITGGGGWNLYDWNGLGDHSLDISVPAKVGTKNGSVTVFLQWDDSWGTSGNNYDLYIVNAGETAIIASSVDLQTGGPNHFPQETAGVENPGAVAVPAKVWIRRFNTPTGPKNLELYVRVNHGSDAMQEHVITADSIFGHPAVPDVISCAAVDQAVGAPWCTIETFSSRGPSTVAFPAVAARTTPYCTGIDGVKVTGVGGFGSPFHGTSASAPHVAAIAALLKSSYPAATPAMIAASLVAGATDCGAEGFDNIYGHGLIDAKAAAKDLFPNLNIPTISAWGLAVMTLLTLTAGTLVLRRHSKRFA